MNVGMTIQTLLGLSRKPLAGYAGCLIYVTLPAGYGCMFARKRKGSPLVIKCNLPPFQYRVTGFAILIRKEFWTDFILMNILMTINTPFSDFPEAPLHPLFVA
jgi:hypothetical protein